MINRLRYWWPVILIILIAAAFRFPLLDSLPPGLNFDEGGEGIAALDVARGDFKILWPIGGGKEPLMAYLVQPLFWIFGPTRLALRLYTALMGVGAVAATYFFARQLFPVDENRASIWRWLPTFAALGLATAFWHVAYSRIAFRALSNPVVVALALGFLWRGLRLNRWRDFLWAGFFTGGLIYTYSPGRFVPVAIALFFALETLLARWRKQTPLLLRYRWKLAGMVGVAAVVFAPIALFYVRNPGTFVERGAAVSIFNPAMNGGDFWGALWRSAASTLGTYLSLTGDPNPLGNIPGKPMLGPLLAAFFVLGLIFTIRNSQFVTKNSTADMPELNPSLLLLILWPVMLLPAILAPENAPHHLRLIGAAPATYILVGLGMCFAVDGYARLVEKFGGSASTLSRRSPWVMLIVVFGLISVQTYRDYFIHWADEVDHTMPFDVYAEDLARQMTAETELGLTWLIPMDLRAAHEARHYSLDFLYRGQSSYNYVPVDELSAARVMTEAVAGKQTLKVVRWVQDKHREADARELVSFLLTTAGAALIGSESHPVYTIETYRLPSPNTQFALPAIETPVDATLDGLIQVRRATVTQHPAGAGLVAVAVTYAPIAPIDADYKASIRLVWLEGGAVVAQKDRQLMHNWHQGTGLWPREEVNEYYLLPLPDDAPAGSYEVRVVIYHPETQVPLTDNGQVEIPLGGFEVQPEQTGK